MSTLIFFFQAEDGIRDGHVTGVQTCALPILLDPRSFRVIFRSFLGSGVRVWQYLFRGLLCIVDVNVFGAGLVIGISIAWLMRSSTDPVLNIVFAWHLIGEGTIFQIIDQLLRRCSNVDCLTLLS